MQRLIAAALLILLASCDPAFAGEQGTGPKMVTPEPGAPAHRRCYSTTSVEAYLGGDRGQRRMFTARVNSRVIIEIWTGADNSEWTLVTTNASGMSCLTGAGRGYWQAPVERPEERGG